MFELGRYLFFSTQKIMKFFYPLFCFFFLFGCISTKKNSYDSLIKKQNDTLNRKNTSSREVAYLKNISQFEESNFQFITKQMKEVVKNYSKMKQQLVKMESKLSELLSQQQILANRSQKTEKLIEENFEEEQFPSEDESSKDTDQLVSEDESSKDTDQLVSEEENSEDIDQLVSEGENSKNTDLLVSKEPPLLQEDITDDTDIFQEEETKENSELRNQKKALAKIRAKQNKKTNEKKSSVLKKAKNLFTKKSYENAISQFQKYRDQNPKGAYYPEATFYIGQSFKNLKMPIEADVFFKEVVKSHPQSLWASRAKKLIKE